jgi:hypothetical protein
MVMSYKPDKTDRLPGLDQIIWRYMDLGRFLDLIDGRLFFPSIQTLARSDKFEGSFPKVSQEGLQNALIERAGLGGEVSTAVVQGMDELHEATRRSVFASCWHLNEVESVAMWSQYARHGEGIAIKSTVGNLIYCLSTNEDYPVRICEITYINYDEQAVPWDRIYLFKRLSYVHEHELRAFYCPRLSMTPGLDLPGAVGGAS